MSERADGRIFELRVHGVSGTPPEAILDEPFPEQVAGDDVARFFRAEKPATTLPGGPKPPRSRIVEAFHWGRFTSGGPSRALWLVLIPFAVLNLSRYMLLGKGKFADGVLRLLGLVLTSILVSNVIYVSLELVVRQCVSSRLCVRDNGWLSFMVSWPFGARVLLGVLPAAVVISLLWWFGRQTFLYEPKGDIHEWKPAAGSLRDHAFCHTSPKAPVLRAAHVAASCGVAGIIYSGALNTDLQDNTAPRLTWLLAIGTGGVLLLLAVLVVAIGPQAKLRPDRRFNDALQVPRRFAVLKWVSLAYFGAALLLAAVHLWGVRDGDAITKPLAGFEVVIMVQGVLTAVLLVIVLVMCLVQRRRFNGNPEDARTAFSPMWSGCAAFVVAALATTLAAGFSGGFAYRVADLLGEPVGKHSDQVDTVSAAVQWQIQLSAAHWTGVLLWGVLAIVFLVLLLPLLAALTRQPAGSVVLAFGSISAASAFFLPDAFFWWFLGAAGVLLTLGLWLWLGRFRSDGLDTLVTRDYAGERDSSVVVTEPDQGKPDADEPDVHEPEPRGIGKIATAWRLARTKYRYHWALGTISVLGGVLVVAAGVTALIRMIVYRRATDPPEWLFSEWLKHVDEVGSWVLSGLAAGLLLVGLRSWRGQKMRTVVGVLWDLIAFWPRYAHPICPPPYGGRATLELISRANYLANLPDPPKAVVLSGHSQGSVVCVAAVLMLEQESKTDDDAGHSYIKSAQAKTTLSRLSLVTYGSQLRWAFARLFPRYLGHAELTSVYKVLGGRWRNVHRWTDPLGGPVLVWQGAEPPPSEITDLLWHGIGGADICKFEKIHAGSEDSPTWGWRLGDDIRLRDPEFIEARDDRPRSQLRRHSGYYRDPIFDEVVADLADEIPAAEPAPASAAEPSTSTVEQPAPLGFWRRLWLRLRRWIPL